MVEVTEKNLPSAEHVDIILSFMNQGKVELPCFEWT